MAKNTMKLDLSGFKELLERIQKVGGNIDAAAEKALIESAKPFVEDLKTGIKKHHRTGLTEASLNDPTQIQREGNRLTLNVGFDLGKGGLPALFLEYGTPHMKADPFIQRSIQRNQSISRKIQKELLTKILKELEP